MQLSTRTRYTVRAMVSLAMEYGKGPVKLKQIADNENISFKYLEQVLLPMRNAGYVRTQKGSQGGYILAIPPEKLSMLEIIKSVEGSLAPVGCADDSEICERSGYCAVHETWINLKEAVCNELDKIALADLAAKQTILNSKK